MHVLSVLSLLYASYLFFICTSSSHCPSEQCEGGEGEQQQSCPCQLDPTHPPSGKRVPCVLCDISTLFTSWASGTCCQHSQHHSLKCGDWWPWPSNWIHFLCWCWHSRGWSTRRSWSRWMHAAWMQELLYINDCWPYCSLWLRIHTLHTAHGTTFCCWYLMWI